MALASMETRRAPDSVSEKREWLTLDRRWGFKECSPAPGAHVTNLGLSLDQDWVDGGVP